MDISGIKRRLDVLKRTPLHPQWLVFRRDNSQLEAICRQIDTGVTIDLGSADCLPKKYIADKCSYYGLDYPLTADNWYFSKPDVYGDAQELPFATGSVDNILLLDVLEHLPNPEQCISEIYRALKTEGKLVLKVPFMYPIHDAPLDFHRWTIHGLSELAQKSGFRVIHTREEGTPVESAALLTNIALVKATLNWLNEKSPLLLLAPGLAVLIPVINLCGAAFSYLGSREPFMAFSYTMTWQKN